MTYEEEDEEVLTAAEGIEVKVAVDSGAVDHVAGPKDIPGTVPVRKSPDGRTINSVGAKGDTIDRYGAATVRLTQSFGQQNL